MAQHEVALHLGTAQIQVAVLEPQLLGGELFAFPAGHGDRRRDRRAHDRQLRRLHLHVAGRELGVLHVRGARGHVALDLDDRLARDSARHSPHLLRGPWPGGDLDDPRSVAQVDENDPAQIPPTVYPATQPHALADVLQAQLAAAVRTSGCGADAVYGTSASHNTR